MPISKNEGDKASLFSASDFLKSKNISFSLPKTVIMAPCSDMGKTLARFSVRSYKLSADIEIINSELAFIHNFALGAPLCVFLAELAAALGAENFILLGTAGALTEGLASGDKVLCRGAFSDEGTGRHYFEGEYISSSRMDSLQELAVKAEGFTWTTDAVFMETRSAVERYAQKGCLTVDMEAAALFAFAKARGLKAGAVFVVSDSLSGGEWRPAKNARPLKVLRALSEELIKKYS